MHQLPAELMQWLYQYGNLSLFLLLAIGIISLPIPEESLMIFAGYLIAKGKWSPVPTFLAAVSGSICGITVSYLLGLTAGNYLLEKYGHFIGLTENKIKHAQHWFNKIGKWCLFFGYFIIGVRHLTGYIAGITLLRYKTFALFAYTGAIVWATTFISLGYFFSAGISRIIEKIDFEVLFIVLASVVLLYISHLIIKWLHKWWKTPRG